GLLSTRTPRTGAGQPQSALSGTRNRSVCVSDRNGATEPGAIVGSAERLTVMLSSTSPRPVNSGAVPTSLPVVWTVCDPVSPLSRFSHSTVAELNGNIDAEKSNEPGIRSRSYALALTRGPHEPSSDNEQTLSAPNRIWGSPSKGNAIGASHAGEGRTSAGRSAEATAAAATTAAPEWRAVAPASATDRRVMRRAAAWSEPGCVRQGGAADPGVSRRRTIVTRSLPRGASRVEVLRLRVVEHERVRRLDRKSTRLNSSHVSISYAVFCLKKKKKKRKHYDVRNQQDRA